MPEFRDHLGRSWPIVLTPQVRNRLTHATGAELIGPVGVAELGALAFRQDALREALWQCCYVDAMDRRISREAFNQSLDAATLRAGFQALAECYAADCFGDKAGAAMGMIASVAGRLKAILTRPIEAIGRCASGLAMLLAASEDGEESQPACSQGNAVRLWDSGDRNVLLHPWGRVKDLGS